jgi:hypothetical protein
MADFLVATLVVGAAVVFGYQIGFNLYQKRKTRESIRQYLESIERDEWRR